MRFPFPNQEFGNPQISMEKKTQSIEVKLAGDLSKFGEEVGESGGALNSNNTSLAADVAELIIMRSR